MRIIDNVETLRWLNNKGILFADEKLDTSGLLSSVNFSIPVDAGKKTNISKNLVPLVTSNEESMLWINEFGIWPSCEIWTLFDGFRKSLGETAPLYEKPGHIFTNKDSEIVVALLGMALFFYWGAVLISPSKNLIVRISHDEFLNVYAGDKNVIGEFEEILHKLCD